MSTPIPDGTYFIQSVQFPRSVIDLNSFHPYGVITGHPRKTSINGNQKWIVKNIKNRITLESDGVRDYYLTVDHFVPGVPIYASPNPTHWTVQASSTTEGAYIIRTNDLLLTLRYEGTFAAIDLQSEVQPPAKAEWTFLPAGGN